jgi:hypothetical protein
MSERVLNRQDVQALRIELAAAERQLDGAFDAMEFDPEESVEGVAQMRLAAVSFHLFCARRMVEPHTSNKVPDTP